MKLKNEEIPECYVSILECNLAEKKSYFYLKTGHEGPGLKALWMCEAV